MRKPSLLQGYLLDMVPTSYNVKNASTNVEFAEKMIKTQFSLMIYHYFNTKLNQLF